jgi:2-isopropylmalate synthase
MLSAEVQCLGQQVNVKGSGSGPIDAFINGFNETTGRSVRVLDYHEHAVGQGANAQAVAYLELRVDDRQTLFGVGMDANIVTASLRAIISGIERAETSNTGAAGAEKVSNA